ncbi:hypothetical protein [uncultured Helicobacter sp.]|uniref:hypothetical protein n=1 Tax=uncultured Helicobacter sp. TaxID=175537 RepID=UPI00374E72D8
MIRQLLPRNVCKTPKALLQMLIFVCSGGVSGATSYQWAKPSASKRKIGWWIENLIKLRIWIQNQNLIP